MYRLKERRHKLAARQTCPAFRMEFQPVCWRKGPPVLTGLRLPAGVRPGEANNHASARPVTRRTSGGCPLRPLLWACLSWEKNVRYFSLLLACLLLSACSQTQRGIGDTLAIAAFGMSDVEVDAQTLRTLPYSSIYARLNDGPQIFVVAAFAEEGQVKWLSSDRVLLVTQNGRLTKTVGYRDNLLEVTDRQHDPLLNPQTLKEGATWTRTLSWTEGQQFHSATAQSVFHLDGREPLEIAGTTLDTLRVEEEVTVPSLGRHYRNHFWIDPATGIVRKAEQYIGPDFIPVNITILKP